MPTCLRHDCIASYKIFLMSSPSSPIGGGALIPAALDTLALSAIINNDLEGAVATFSLRESASEAAGLLSSQTLSALPLRATASGEHSLNVLKKMDPSVVNKDNLNDFELEEIFPSRSDRKEECSALLSLYHSTNGASWKNQAGWAFDPNDRMFDKLSSWFGVSTNRMEENRVTGLELGFNGLKGTVPIMLQKCSKLRVLDLQKNSLFGKIGDGIANLSLLTELNLSKNRFSGPIPDPIYQMKFLKKLDLSRNAITGAIAEDVSDLVSLKQFHIDFNELSGPLPINLLTMLQSLESYRMKGNQFYLPEPSDEDVIKFEGLRELVLPDCGLSGELPVFYMRLATSLERFSFQANDGLILTENWDPLRECEILDQFRMHDLAGSIPESIRTLVNLRVLCLDSNLITGSIPSALGELENLEVLNLSHNMLEGSLPLSLSNLERLEELRIGSNRLTGIISDSYSRLQSLRSLDVRENRLMGTIPGSFRNLTLLTELNISDNNMAGDFPSCIEHMTGLETLDISKNGFRGAIPRCLGNLTNMRYLYLQDNKLTGKFPGASLNKMRNLKDLRVDGNSLSGPFPNYQDFHDHILNLGSTAGDSYVSSDSVIATELAMWYPYKTHRHKRNTQSCACNIS